MKDVILPMLSPEVNLESKEVMKALLKASRALAVLNGFINTIQNKNALVNTITIKEAKDSSEIDDIITSHDELFTAICNSSDSNFLTKEVASYWNALLFGYEKLQTNSAITTEMIFYMKGYIGNGRIGNRKLPGTVHLDSKTKKFVYIGSFRAKEIYMLLKNLEEYINEDNDGTDQLIKLAVINYQLVCIRPFYDGNKKIGRAISNIYLVLSHLLELPILNISSYLLQNKTDYERLLQNPNITENLGEWIVYYLKGIEDAAKNTLRLVKKINDELTVVAAEIKEKLPKLYSKEIIDLLFYDVYTKIQYVEKGLSVSRHTAAGYLEALEEKGFLVSKKIGTEKIYQNKRLYDLIK